jgi:tetratricopeptide (TPR) repeat protein
MGAFGVGSYNRRDVLRILEISSHQLQGWERAGLIPQQQSYSFQDLGQLRTLRLLRENSVPAASIRDSILAMKAVAGMANPLLEARVVRTGTRLAFRHHGAMVDPIRRQLLFDFESVEHLGPDQLGPGQLNRPSAKREPAPLLPRGQQALRSIADLFQFAVQSEESGDKQRAIALYGEVLALDPNYAPACINLGTLHFHLREFTEAEELYRHATEADPNYVLAYFDLGNVLDELERLNESIAAYRKAIALAPRYADAHYNLALAYERLRQPRAALRHWQAYIKIDSSGPWSEHARHQIYVILNQEKLSIASRADHFIPPRKTAANLTLV